MPVIEYNTKQTKLVAIITILGLEGLSLNFQRSLHWERERGEREREKRERERERDREGGIPLSFSSPIIGTTCKWHPNAKLMREKAFNKEKCISNQRTITIRRTEKEI